MSRFKPIRASQKAPEARTMTQLTLVSDSFIRKPKLYVIVKMADRRKPSA